MTSRPTSGSGGFSWGAGLLLMALLLLPILALRQIGFGVDWRGLALAWLIICGVTYVLYRADKQRAEKGEWRIPESTLHLAELLGGWPGAYLAQRVYRHKTAKLSFQVVFWIIVLAHQFVAGDGLTGWKYSKDVFAWIKTLLT